MCVVRPLPGIVLSICCCCCCCRCCSGCCCEINMLPFSTTYAAFQAWRILKGRAARPCRALPRLCACVSLMTACLSEQGLSVCVSVCMCACAENLSHAARSVACSLPTSTTKCIHSLLTLKRDLLCSVRVYASLCICVCVCESLCTD